MDEPKKFTTIPGVRIGDWITTFSGRQFWPLDPRQSEISIEDIAHALARICRWNGHTREFYSVAQHSLLVSSICDPVDALAGLLHDGSEAYLCDIPTPIKRAMPEYRQWEANLQREIWRRFGCAPDMPTSVHEADRIVLFTEKRDLCTPGAPWGWGDEIRPMADRIEPMSPQAAEFMFLQRFDDLSSKAAPVLAIPF